MAKRRLRFRKKSLTGTVRQDLLAALVVTAIAIPESLGLAIIAGLPPITGLYSAFIAPIIYAIFASSRRLVVGVSSATSALVASGAVMIAVVGTRDYLNAVVVLGVLTGVILVLMGLMRLGLLADLISKPVLIGFLGGVGVQLVVMNFPALLGMDVQSGLTGTVEALLHPAGAFNGMTATISLLVVGIALLMRRNRLPGELVGLVAAALFVIIFGAGSYGVKMIGELPSGLPNLVSFHTTPSMILTLLPAAAALALVILVQSSSVLRVSASEHDERLRLNRDLFALGASNIASAIGQGFTINGSPPRTFASMAAGGKTRMVNVWTGVMVGLILVLAYKFFAIVPQAALSAIVVIIGFRLIQVSELKRIWSVRRREFWVAVVALAGTAIFGVLTGVILAIIASIGERFASQYRPRDSILLRDGELSGWAVDRLGSEHNLPKELMIYGFMGPIFFENVQYFSQRVSRAIESSKTPVWSVIIDMSTVDSIDYTAAEQISTLVRELEVDGITLGFAHVAPDLHKQMLRFGLTTLVGDNRVFPTLNAAVSEYRNVRQSVEERVDSLGLDKGSYVLAGGAVLDLLGLRDAAGIDVVVDRSTYNQFRKKHDWDELVHAEGRKVLSNSGRNLMTYWAGKSLAKLQEDAWTYRGVEVASIAKLISGKQRIGRRKDLADIRLLRQYLKSHGADN